MHLVAASARDPIAAFLIADLTDRPPHNPPSHRLSKYFHQLIGTLAFVRQDLWPGSGAALVALGLC